MEGYALAGGTEVALSTDLIVAARDSAFGIPEVTRGLVAGGGGLLRLPQRIPYAVAMELALTGETLSAERAHELGLVSVLAEPGGALDAAVALAMAATKKIIVESRYWGPKEQWTRADEDSRPGVHVEGRAGRCDRVRREARAQVDGQLTGLTPTTVHV